MKQKPRLEKAKEIKPLSIAGERVRDPFDLSLSWTQLTTKEKDQILESIESSYQKPIQEAFEEDREATTAILCKGKVVEVDKGFISLEKLQGLEEKYGTICIPIVNQRRFTIEESTWNDLTAERRGDYYPTVPINVGAGLWPDPTVFQKVIRITADFDTGNWGVLALPIETCREILPIKDEEILFASRHLERRYYYAVKKFKIGVEDIDRDRRTILRQVFCVEDWPNSPLTATNPKREAFLGRDVMLEFPFEARLNPLTRRTTIKLL